MIPKKLTPTRIVSSEFDKQTTDKNIQVDRHQHLTFDEWTQTDEALMVPYLKELNEKNGLRVLDNPEDDDETDPNLQNLIEKISNYIEL